jgi:hypothetical protein
MAIKEAAGRSLRTVERESFRARIWRKICGRKKKT